MTDNGSNSLATTSGAAIEQADSPLAHALAQREIASVQARWTLARRFPRNVENFRTAILKECQRPGFADGAIYGVPRGRKEVVIDGRKQWVDNVIEGLSIRFAESAHRLYQNVDLSEQIVAEDEASLICEVTGTDLEANASWRMQYTVPKTVERKHLGEGQRAISQRVNSYGKLVFLVQATDEEIATTLAAKRSKAFRSVLLRLLPGDILEACEAAIRKTCEDKTAKDPDAARRELYDSFAKLGVTPAMLVEFIEGQPLESVSPAQLSQLRAVWASIRDGEATWPEWMATKKPAAEAKEKDPKGEALREKLAAAGKRKAPAQEKAKPAYDPTTGEVDPAEEAQRGTT